MSAPALHPVAHQVYRLLPDYVRNADASQDYALARFVGAGSVGLERANEFLTIIDPSSSLSGTNELLNSAATPRAYLAWLAWLVGVDISNLAPQDVRPVLSNVVAAQYRGSRAAVRDAVQRTLTNSQPARVWANLDGVTPYLITVVTNESQTPDESGTLLAALTEKPAGMLLELQVVQGAVILELEVVYDLVTDLESAFATVSDLDAWIPAT
jgi:hypothetical protein